MGDLWIAVSKRGLCLIEFGERPFPPKESGVEWVRSEEKTRAACQQLEEYFGGTRKEFTLPLDLRRGTGFQKDCWNTLCAIPYGQTRSYAQVAQSVGRPTAFRAVGQANHHNPIPIIIPCHRVLNSDGKLGGYGGGLQMKRQLLALEGAWHAEEALLRFSETNQS